MARKHFYQMKSFYIALGCSGLFLATLVSTTYAWFSTNRTATVNFTGAQAVGGGIESLEWKIYRNDETYLDETGHKNSDGSANSDDFSMNQFDRLIPDKNDVAALIFEGKLTLTVAADTSKQHLLASVITSNTSFGSETDTDSGIYNLSDAVNFKALSDISYTSGDKYSVGRTAFEASSQTAQTFVSGTEAGDSKASAVNFDLSLTNGSTTAYVYIDFNYQESLLQAIYSIATGGKSYDDYTGDSVSLLCDFQFYLQLEDGAVS